MEEDVAVLEPLISATGQNAPSQNQPVPYENGVSACQPPSQHPDQAESSSTSVPPPPLMAAGQGAASDQGSVSGQQQASAPAPVQYQAPVPPSAPGQPPVVPDHHSSGDGIIAMTTQEALRIYAPHQKIRDKIVADYKKGLDPEHMAAKHGVAPSTICAVIKRHQEAERSTLPSSLWWRHKKKADAEEAARRAAQQENGSRHVCDEPDFVKVANQGACVACTVKFQSVALGKPMRSRANVKRSRTQFGCRNCRVHLCRKGYCWDIFHKHVKG